MRQIPPHPLWLGNRGDVREPFKLLDSGIAALIDLAADEPPIDAPRELVYARFPLIDSEGNPRWLLQVAIETVFNLLHSGTSTLIVCSSGHSRSPAVAAIALARIQSLPPNESLARIARCGPADVTPGLWRDLIISEARESTPPIQAAGAAPGP